jgi:homoserine dehydrogenase
VQHKKLTIGLFGFGVVGEGVYKVLQQTPSLQATIKKVCIRNPNKKRNAPAELFTTEKELLLEDPSINIIVEVIDDATAAYKIVRTALLNGKAVVSANKKMIAEHLPALLSLQEATGLPFLYEAAACASIPVIRNLEEYYDNDLLRSIRAVVNGSTNFILSKIFDDKLSFKDALLQAQQLGFAESDPTLDIEGFDAANKWIFLLTHAYGIITSQADLVFGGITKITSHDASVAVQKNYSIKLVAQANKLANGTVAAFVLPQFVPPTDPLAFIKYEYNGVVIESAFADKQFFYGKGAGSYPTASAVLSDISALRYDYRYEYKKLYHHKPNVLTNDFYVRTYISFDNWKDVPHDEFESIEEWHANEERKYLVGIIHFNKLREGAWWKEHSVSLILMPDPIIESMELPRIQKKSLELGTWSTQNTGTYK